MGLFLCFVPLAQAQEQKPNRFLPAFPASAKPATRTQRTEIATSGTATDQGAVPANLPEPQAVSQAPLSHAEQSKNPVIQRSRLVELARRQAALLPNKLPANQRLTTPEPAKPTESIAGPNDGLSAPSLPVLDPPAVDQSTKASAEQAGKPSPDQAPKQLAIQAPLPMPNRESKPVAEQAPTPLPDLNKPAEPKTGSDAKKSEQPSASLSAAQKALTESSLTVVGTNNEASGPNAALAPLELNDVLTSLENLYPLLESARQEPRLALGELLQALGSYDLNLYADSMTLAHGFYQNTRNSVAVEQLTPWGAKVFAGYRIGRGTYPSYYQDRETYDGGEFSAGIKMPWLQNRAIDKYRLAVRQARIDQRIAQPMILEAQLTFVRAASFAYWDWVATGLSLKIGETN